MDQKTNTALEIVQCFDAVRIDAFGKQAARPWPGGADVGIAANWITAGADVDLCRQVFQERMFKMAAGGKSPPAFQYFEEPITQAVAARRRSETDNARQVDPDSTEAHRDRGIAAADRLRERLRASKEAANG